MSDSFRSEAVIVRNEKVYKAPISGNITYFANKNHRISGGQLVAKINSNNKNVSIYSRQAGILSYSYDSLENELTPENMKQITPHKFNNIKNDYKKLKNNEYINKGESFFRIVNNSDIYALIKVDKNKAEKFWINETIFIKDDFETDSKLFEAKINKIISSNNKSFLIIEFDKFINEWLNVRKKEIEFIKNIYKGLIIPDSAVLPTSDGYKAVKIDENNNFNLENIEIIFNGEKYMIIEGLELGDEVLINPAKSNFEIESK